MQFLLKKKFRAFLRSIFCPKLFLCKFTGFRVFFYVFVRNSIFFGLRANFNVFVYFSMFSCVFHWDPSLKKIKKKYSGLLVKRGQ